MSAMDNGVELLIRLNRPRHLARMNRYHLLAKEQADESHKAFVAWLEETERDGRGEG